LRGGKRKGRAYWSGGYCPVSAGNPSWRAILGGEGFETRKNAWKRKGNRESSRIKKERVDKGDGGQK
jgi:hypothetical protein